LFSSHADSSDTAQAPIPSNDRLHFTPTLFPFLKTGTSVMPVTAGQVLLSDITGNPIARITAAVSGGGWVAIPSQACVGAREWVFQTADGAALEITGGIMGDSDSMGLWQIENGRPFSGPPLSAARLDAPLVWISLVSDRSVTLSRLMIQSEQMNVIHLSLPSTFDGPGVFIQDGRMVGWTFGELVEGGFLWKGPDENNLVMELGVEDFYRLTFEGGREEQMTIAYGMDDAHPLQALAAFADGFRLAPTLLAEKTPSHLRTGALINEMRLVMSKIIERGESASIPDVFDGPALAGTGDIKLMLDVLTIMGQAAGPEKTADVIDDILMASQGLNEDEIRHLQEFRNALNEKIQKSEKDKVIIRFSPDSDQIRARGILNNRLFQNFVVDTGASMVTIPSAAAKAMGLDVRSAPRRRITTAGGMIEAPEVLLDAVEFDGWIEYDVTAYVIDLPDQSGLGLLGLNYLNRFRMDVNTASGELTLEPR